MAAIVERYKKGRITLSVVKGEHKGKATTSFVINKRIPDGDKWKTSNFLTITDLLDVLILVTRVCSDYVKYEKVDPKPNGS